MKVYISHAPQNDALVQELTRALSGSGYTVTPIEAGIGADLASAISSAIRDADVLVALPGSSSVNVYYEMGIAAGANVPIVLAMPRDQDVPFDVRAMPFVLLTGEIVRDALEIVRRVAPLAIPRQDPRHEKPSPAESATDALQNRDAAERLSGPEFEELVSQLLMQRGFDVRRVPPHGFAGYDLEIVKKGPAGGRWLVECKRYSAQNRVGAAVVRQLLGLVAAERAAGGLLIASSGFTASARALAERTPVDLLTIDDLIAIAPETRD
ncbi:MAG TPA: restriction endonuclease [Solirubrobacteraceae bacterium]|nr:restriction endonuclease [Solirubrobacteraceae bacterium]